jgi:hypothetical protein
MTRVVLAVAVCIAMQPAALASTVRLQLFSAERTQVHCRAGRVRAEAWCGSQRCTDRAAVVASWTFKDRGADVALQLARDVPWRVVLEGDRCWTPPLTIPNVAADETLTMYVWPAATFEGTFALPKGERAPATLEGSVEAEKTAEIAATIPDTSVSCAIAGAQWRCTVPATPLDLRLAARGFVPQYFWGVDAPAGGRKALGALPLLRGASISGRVALPDRTKAPQGIDVELRPAGLTLLPADERRAAARSRTAKTNDRGFYQFSGVAEGAYMITARKTGWSRATREVRVDGAREAAAGLMILPPLARAEVIIDPPLDSAGRRWRVILDRETVRATGTAALAEGTAGADGRWWRDGLEAGTYLLRVSDGGGNDFERTRINVVPNAPPLHLSFSAIVVRGTVRIGDRPLRADLTFQSQEGSSSVTLASGENGELAGTLPHEGKWRVEAAPYGTEQLLGKKNIEVKLCDGVARVDIVFPAGIVAGQVVDESGKPARAAIRLGPKNGPMVYVRTQDDGKFELVGVDPGHAEIEASRRTESSGLVPVTIGKDRAEELKLTLRRKRTINGWVVSPSGAPIAGAVVHITRPMAIEETVSGPAGDFVVHVPRGIAAIDIAICAIGYPVKLVHIPISAEMENDPRFVLGTTGGVLVAKVGTRPWPWIRFRGGFMPLTALLTGTLGSPSLNPVRRGGLEFLLEPGTYTVCPTKELSPRCMQHDVRPSGEWVVDVAQWAGQP